MRRHRLRLLAVLVYVLLDLSLPAMPGAFVFDPDASVECVRNSRDGGGAGVVVLPASRGPLFAPLPPPTVVVDGPAPVDAAVPRVRPVARRLPRPTLELPPPSEDPH